MIRKISAGLIFPVNLSPIKNGIICFDETGLITEIITPVNGIDNIERLEYFDGVLIPAFIPENVDDVNSRVRLSLALNIFLKEYVDFVRDTLKIIYNQQSMFSFHKLLEKFTFDRAIELNLEKSFGSLGIGKKPGIIQISNFNFKNMNINDVGNFKIISLPHFNFGI